MVIPDPLNGEPFIHVRAGAAAQASAQLNARGCARRSLRRPLCSRGAAGQPPGAGCRRHAGACFCVRCPPHAHGALPPPPCSPHTTPLHTTPPHHTQVPDTQLYEIEPFVASLRATPKSGMHNPLKSPERCAGQRAGRGGAACCEGLAAAPLRRLATAATSTHTHTHTLVPPGLQLRDVGRHHRARGGRAAPARGGGPFCAPHPAYLAQVVRAGGGVGVRVWGRLRAGGHEWGSLRHTQAHAARRRPRGPALLSRLLCSVISHAGCGRDAGDAQVSGELQRGPGVCRLMLCFAVLCCAVHAVVVLLCHSMRETLALRSSCNSSHLPHRPAAPPGPLPGPRLHKPGRPRGPGQSGLPLAVRPRGAHHALQLPLEIPVLQVGGSGGWRVERWLGVCCTAPRRARELAQSLHLTRSLLPAPR